MSFSDEERSVLTAVRGVGPRVIERLEALGIASLDELARRDPQQICAGIAEMVGSTCWKNSPQAQASIRAAVMAARARPAPPAAAHRNPAIERQRAGEDPR